MSVSRIFRCLVIALALVGEPFASAFALPLVTAPDVPQAVIKVNANCYAIGQKMASQKGGDLMQASQSSRGGKPVCHIVIRIPGNDGKRPRRAEFTVPAD